MKIALYTTKVHTNFYKMYLLMLWFKCYTCPHFLDKNLIGRVVTDYNIITQMYIFVNKY